MSYLINGIASIQANSATQTFSNKYTLAGLEVTQTGSTSVSLTANTDYYIVLAGVIKIFSISVRSQTNPVQYAIGDVGTVTPIYSSLGNFHMFVSETGTVGTRIYIRSNANTTVELSYSGRAV